MAQKGIIEDEDRTITKEEGVPQAQAMLRKG
jgi:hypothetical protein